MTKSQELIDWLYEQKCRNVVDSLRKNGFTAEYCDNKNQAKDYIVREALNVTMVAIGGSVSISEMGIAGILREMGKEVFDTNSMGEIDFEARRPIYKKTMDGFLVNIDASGNRVASMIFGLDKVIIVAGRNKLVKDKEEALQRIKNFVAPCNNRRLEYQCPCYHTALCSDCRSPERTCRIMVVLERMPRLTDVRVLVVNNEDMGL